MELTPDFYKNETNQTVASLIAFDPHKYHDSNEFTMDMFWVYLLAFPSLLICWFAILHFLRNEGFISHREANNVMQDLNDVSIPFPNIMASRVLKNNP